MSTFEEKKAELAKHIDVPERAMPEHAGFSFGDRVRVLEDDEDRGLFEGAEGVLIIEQVGAPEYNNVRTALYFVEDGMESGNEVHADDIEQA